MVKVISLFLALIVSNLTNFGVNLAKIQEIKPKKGHFYKNSPSKRDPKLDLLLKELNKGRIKPDFRNISVMFNNLRLIESVLGKDVLIKANKSKSKIINYTAFVGYNTLKLRLWAANGRTSVTQKKKYRPVRLIEYKNGNFLFILTLFKQKMTLKFVPRGKFYQIIIKYG